MALIFDSITFDTSFDDVGDPPEPWILYSTDEASVSTPAWITATSDVRSFSTSRGRENELAEVDAGTATITLDNRTRTFDPVSNALIRPMNRWWIRVQLAGETQDIFKGYANSYDQTWPGKVDALAIVSCSDEMKVLALDHLPTMNPPRDSYEALIQSDIPAGYWRWSDTNLEGWTHVSGTYGVASATPIVGDYVGSLEAGDHLSGYLGLGAGGQITASPESFDTRGSSFLTVEFWYRYSAAPAAPRTFFEGATGADLGAGIHRIFYFSQLESGAVHFLAHNNSNTLHTVSSTVLAVNTWYYIVGAIDGSNIRIFVNGVQAASASWSGALRGGGNLDPDWPPRLLGSPDVTHDIDEIAFYPARYLGTDRFTAHYEAGVERGFPRQQTASERFNAVLDTAGSTAPRNVVSGGNFMQGVFMKGQDPLGELRQCVKAEGGTSVMFISRSGKVVFYPEGWVEGLSLQATFDDDGTDLPYTELELDYGESFLYNEINSTRPGGALQTTSDTASISLYGKRPLALTDIPVTTNALAAGIGTTALAKYKDPMTRITSITLTSDVPAVAEAMFRRDIGDKIRILRTPPGGGTRIDQTSFIQKIEITATPYSPWQVKWAVSPL